MIDDDSADGLGWREIGRIMGMSHANARMKFLKVVAKFLMAYAPSLSEPDAMRLASRHGVQVAVRELIDKALAQK